MKKGDKIVCVSDKVSLNWFDIKCGNVYTIEKEFKRLSHGVFYISRVEITNGKNIHEIEYDFLIENFKTLKELRKDKLKRLINVQNR
jgi:hypothetical protein